MIGVDSNILVRLLVRDDDRQWRAAQTLLSRCSPHEPGRVCLIVLVEVAWTLRRVYGYSRHAIAQTVESLITTAELALEQEELVVQALEFVRARNVDLTDVLIALLNEDSGCSATLTFDRVAAKAGIMTLLEEA